MSACSRVLPAAWAAQVASRPASSARRARDHGSMRSSSGVAERVRQPVKSVPRYSATEGTVAGAGVRASASRSSAASTKSSSPSRHGSSGWWPATSSTTSANHGPSSAVPHSRGTGRCPAAISESSSVSTLASWRCSLGASGLSSADAALTKHRVPSAQRTRAATPGLKPPGWVWASTTGAPHTRSIAPRIGRGTSCQATLAPSAGGALTPGSVRVPPHPGQPNSRRPPDRTSRTNPGLA
jgi:hypothetical protein